MTDSERAKEALAALADGETGSDDTSPTAERASTGPRAGAGGADYRAVIERATEATRDIEAAAEFVETVGLDRLETAVERAEREVSERASEGRAALATFERFRVAAAGPMEG
jgi:hypothetical protein